MVGVPSGIAALLFHICYNHNCKLCPFELFYICFYSML